MAEDIRDTKKIAKNTIVLYICMAITMLVTLYSSRLVLQALGFNDFGLYNVVCGVAALLSFMKTSLTTSIQRFLSFEIGRGDQNQLQRVFSMSVTTHFAICLIIIILSNTIGLWFLNTQIQIAPERVEAANWIFQFSIISLCLSTLSIPYTADIISHEQMNWYAVVHVAATILKLFAAIWILYINTDKLIVYGLLMALIELISLVLYWGYCRRKYQETPYHFFFDKELFNKIFAFSGWTILGQISVVGANNGTNVLVNIYYNVVVNAAMGIAQQVNNAITGLTSNFQTAFQPQITKSYAVKDTEYLNSIICKASKISYFLLFLVSIPVIINIHFLLQLWLGKVPEYAAKFSILFLVASWMNAISTPLWIATYATGKIRNYQIAISLVFFSDIFIVWGLFHYFDVPPTMSMAVKVIINMIVVFVRLYFTTKQIDFFSCKEYLQNVIARCLVCTILVIAPMIICMLVLSETIKLLGSSILLFAFAFIVAYYIGFTRSEQQTINSFTLKTIHKITNRI